MVDMRTRALVAGWLAHYSAGGQTHLSLLHINPSNELDPVLKRLCFCLLTLQMDEQAHEGEQPF